MDDRQTVFNNYWSTRWVDFDNDTDTTARRKRIAFEAFDAGWSAALTDEVVQSIRAEIRAEALKEAAEKALEVCHEYQKGVAYVDLVTLRAAILADEPKEERGAEGHDTSQPCPRCGVVPFVLNAAPIDPGIASAYRAVCASCGHPVSATFSPVERRIEKAGL